MNARWSVLVAEDNENDVLILRHVFAKVSKDVSLAFINDGEEAIKYLRGENGFGDRSKYPFPDVLLLDLKMPRLDGFDVLTWIRNHPPIHRLRVIVFTSSGHELDVERAYDLGASSYFRKPAALNDMKSVVDCLRDWLEINQFAIIEDAQYSRRKSSEA